MPQLHHRDPSIIGLLGASPHLASNLSPKSPASPTSASFTIPRTPSSNALANRIKGALGEGPKATSEAFDELTTPPQTPVLAGVDSDLQLKKGEKAEMPFERPFYELIVDGIHSHPNSVRVCTFAESSVYFSLTFPIACVLSVPRGMYLNHGWYVHTEV